MPSKQKKVLFYIYFSQVQRTGTSRTKVASKNIFALV